MSKAEVKIKKTLDSSNKFTQIKYSNTIQTTINNNECRICLQGDQSNNELIAPCKCTGSVKYTHTTCLKQWAYRIIKDKNGINSTKTEIECQLCKEMIPIEVSTDLKCHSLDQIKQNISQNQFLFSILILVKFICFCGFGFGAYYISTFGINFSSKRIASSIIVICSIILLAIVNILIWYQITVSFILHEVISINKIGGNYHNDKQIISDIKEAPRKQSIIKQRYSEINLFN